MSVYVSRLLDRWLSSWTVTTFILVGVLVGYLLTEHYFSAHSREWMCMCAFVGILVGLAVVNVYGRANGNRQRELLFAISTFIWFLNISNIERVVGSLGGLWLGYVGVISFISFIAEIRETNALFRRQRLSTKTIRAFPDVSSRPDWMVTQQTWKLPPKRMYWSPVLVLLLSGLVVAFVVCLIAFFS